MIPLVMANEEGKAPTHEKLSLLET